MARKASSRTRVQAAAAGALKGVSFEPLSIARWRDLEALFGERGACGGCWCMVWRLPRSAWEQGKGAANRRALKRIVAGGEPTGVIAYQSGIPIGWCAVAPRDHYGALARSRVLRPIDEKPVWSITCFFIERSFRRRGLSVRLLRAAAEYAREQGARIVEGYPVEPYSGAMPDAFAWVGTVAAFQRAGFREVARRSPSRPIMRRILKPKSS